MKKKSIIGIILIIIGTLLLITGIIINYNNEKKRKHLEFMANTTNSFKMEVCHENLCVSNLKVTNSSENDTKLEFELTNKGDKRYKASNLKLVFDTGDKVAFSCNDLQPSEVEKFKLRYNKNLGLAMSYDLEED